MGTLTNFSGGKRYSSKKFCYEADNNLPIALEDDREIEWRDFGETLKPKKPINLIKSLRRISNTPSWFRYFLDGSRHTYKIEDMSFKDNIYPIIAGQVGISCCRRDNKEMQKEFFNRKLVIVLPNSAFKSRLTRDAKRKELLALINEIPKLKQYNLKFDDIMSYDLSTDITYEHKGIAKIQDYMVEQEKLAVIELASQKKLKPKSYLIKDGSLEYQSVKDKNLTLSEERMKNAYKYVIGVSKSFNPSKCYIKGGGTNSSYVAELKLFERTPAYLYEVTRSGRGVFFCVWYLRLHDSKYTNNIFDGIVKIEKIVTDEEKKSGVDSETIDNISAHLLRERFPVCYGSDKRWANHLYPIYMTERFAKSKYISDKSFLNLF